MMHLLMVNHAQDEAEALVDRLKASSGGTTNTSPSSHVFDTPANVNAQNARPPNVPTSSGVHARDACDTTNGSNVLGSLHDRQGLPSTGPESGERSQLLANQQTAGRDNDLPLFPIDGYMNIDSSNFDFYPQDGLGLQRGIDEETGAAILEPVTRFSSAIFRTQAETLVMASVVADYIAWLRKAPPGGGIPTAKESPVYLGMLDNLEIRLRELCEMSQSRSTDALKELVAALGAMAPPGGTMAARLGSLEEDLQKEAQERAEVFRSRYNPCALLSQQADKTSE